MESLISKRFVQSERVWLDAVLFCSRAASAAIVGDILMARNTIRQLRQLLPAVAVVATAFATSQPVTGLIDPGTSNDDVGVQLSITRFTEASGLALRGPSIAQLQIRGAQGPRP